MKTKAAVLWGLHQKWEVDEVDLDGPEQAEVMVKLTASVLCHSDYHLVTGDLPAPLPIVGGHEGAGVVVEVGPGVTEVAEGDHVVMSFIPAGGRCTACARGMSNLCELGAYLVQRYAARRDTTLSCPGVKASASSCCSAHSPSTRSCRRHR